MGILNFFKNIVPGFWRYVHQTYIRKDLGHAYEAAIKSLKTAEHIINSEDTGLVAKILPAPGEISFLPADISQLRFQVKMPKLKHDNLLKFIEAISELTGHNIVLPVRGSINYYFRDSYHFPFAAHISRRYSKDDLIASAQAFVELADNITKNCNAIRELIARTRQAHASSKAEPIDVVQTRNLFECPPLESWSQDPETVKLQMFTKDEADNYGYSLGGTWCFGDAENGYFGVRWMKARNGGSLSARITPYGEGTKGHEFVRRFVMSQYPLSSVLCLPAIEPDEPDFALLNVSPLDIVDKLQDANTPCLNKGFSRPLDIIRDKTHGRAFIQLARIAAKPGQMFFTFNQGTCAGNFIKMGEMSEAWIEMCGAMLSAYCQKDGWQKESFTFSKDEEKDKKWEPAFSLPDKLLANDFARALSRVAIFIDLLPQFEEWKPGNDLTVTPSEHIEELRRGNPKHVEKAFSELGLQEPVKCEDMYIIDAAERTKIMQLIAELNIRNKRHH